MLNQQPMFIIRMPTWQVEGETEVLVYQIMLNIVKKLAMLSFSLNSSSVRCSFPYTGCEICMFISPFQVVTDYFYHLVLEQTRYASRKSLGGKIKN